MGKEMKQPIVYIIAGPNGAGKTMEQGGHNIPTSVIQRRYASGLKNLFQLYRPLANVLRLYDAAFLPPQVVSHEEKGDLKIYETDAYVQISTWGQE